MEIDLTVMMEIDESFSGIKSYMIRQTQIICS